MSWLVFLFGLLLLAFAGVSARGALDLLPTELGFFYANAAALAACAGVITLSIGALIRRVDALGKRLKAPQTSPAPPPPVEAAPGPIDATAPVGEAHEEPLHEDVAPAEPVPAAPRIIGRRSANGLDYAIYSDGSVEVNTPDGVRRYASIAELRGSLAPADQTD